ncbi:ABC transporter permease [Flavitalea flava]
MFKSYFKIAWRNLFRNKLHAFINIGGLTIGFTLGIVILLVVYSQFSYDSSHANGNKLYQAYQVFNKTTGEEIANQFGYPAGPAFKKEALAIEKMTRFMDVGNRVQFQEKEFAIPVKLADEDFFSMFSFTILSGNKGNPLKNLTDIVLTEYAAKMIFGNQDPIGKRIKASTGEKLQEFVVSAVIKDPNGSSLKFDILARIENVKNYAESNTDWNNSSHLVYVQLKDGSTRKQAEDQLKEINKRYLAQWYTNLAKEGAKPDRRGDIFATRLLPLCEIHFSTRVNGHKAVNAAMIYTMLTVGLLIILIASFNFININLANAFTRSKEIGIRKCLGAAKGRLFTQLWGESFLLCCIAFIISLLLLNILVGYLSRMVRMDVSLNSLMREPAFLSLALMLLLFVSFIAGGYPSWLMAKFKAVDTLKGKVSLKKNGGLRNALIVIQFVIACIMISCTWIIYRQFQHLQEADLGFQKEYVISVPLYKADKGRETIEKLRTRLAADPRIVSITGSNINIGRGQDKRTVKSSTGFDYKGRSISTNMVSVDYDYLKTLGLRPLEGRDFDRSFGTDTQNNVVISESLARQLHEKEIIGKNIAGDSSWAGWHIVGVFPDFHLYSMQEELEPLILRMDKNSGINYCFIKTSAQNPVTAMQAIKKEMAVLEPGQEFRGTFLDENITNWYQEERMMSLLFSIAAAIAIFLSCTGLFAMVLLIIQQRLKEIGVRKVLGASVRAISLLLSRDFLSLVGLAILIATPISWFIMHKWLQSFPYRIEIRWWMFALVALMALIIAVLTISVNTVKAALQNPVKNLRSE